MPSLYVLPLPFTPGTKLAQIRLAEMKTIEGCPVFNRNGYYRDRLKRLAWYEIGGKTYTMDFLYSDFSESLHIHEARERPIRKVDLDALGVLEEANLLSKEQKQLLYVERNWRANTIFGKGVLYRMRMFLLKRGTKLTIAPLPLP